ncbi:MAG: PaaI family thioesterase [Candidatus Latescibacteria bacterium]|nr:PaaI family thioesterase [Candidatus Latescibacterota bacterium]
MNSRLTQWLTEEDDTWSLVDMPNHVTQGNFVSGDPDGNRLRIQYFTHFTGLQLMSKVWFGPGTQGPPGCVHGGSIAAVLDEAMGATTWLAGYTAVAAEITVTFHKMLPLDTCCLIEPRVVEVDGRKIYTKAEIMDRDGMVYSEGKGLYITVDASKFGKMVDHARALLGDEQSPAAE